MLQDCATQEPFLVLMENSQDLV